MRESDDYFLGAYGNNQNFVIRLLNRSLEDILSYFELNISASFFFFVRVLKQHLIQRSRFLVKYLEIKPRKSLRDMGFLGKFKKARSPTDNPCTVTSNSSLVSNNSNARFRLSSPNDIQEFYLDMDEPHKVWKPNEYITGAVSYTHLDVYKRQL